LLAIGHVAAAAPRHVMVMRADGNADAGWRTRIDTQVLKLAKNIEGTVEAGDISYSDAAAAVGCSVTDLTCKDEVIATMGVDEIVVATVGSGAGGELKVTVKLFAKGAPPKEATTTIAAGQAPDAKMNSDIGPMFGVITVATAPADTKPADAKPADTKAVDTSPKPVDTKPAVADTKPTDAKPADATAAGGTPDAKSANAQVRTAQADTVTAAPDNHVDSTPGEPSDTRLPVIGMATGGGLMLIGVIFWAEANSTQNDINSFPTPRSPKDFQKLTDLESRGDTYATVGNVSFIGGLAVAAVSGYFYWRDRNSAHGARHARLTPAVFPHGGGIALSFGGSP
jgi:hypothetical protein